MKAAVVFAAGPVSAASFERLRSHVTVDGDSQVNIDDRAVDVSVAADGGFDLAARLGVTPTLIIGDMDSVDSDALANVDRTAIEVREFPVAKDLSDYELAIRAAVDAGAEHVTVVGSDSGRLDHLYATLLTLASPTFASTRLDAWLGGNYLAVLNGSDGGPSSTVALSGAVGAQLSLFSLNGESKGVSTSGLRWELSDDVLTSGSSRGVSNEFASETASIRIRSGCLAVVVPETVAPEDQEVSS